MILSKDILEQQHTAMEYLQWVEDLIEKVKSQNGVESVRLKDGLSKELMEEALPVALFASRHYDCSPDVNICLKVGSQHFDAVVEDNRNQQSPIKYLEVTSTTVVGANNGYEDYLFKYHLHHSGNGGTGKISHIGSKRNGLVTNLKREVVSQSDVLIHEKKTVIEAIERKLKPHYPDNTALIISFDDRFAFDRKDNIDNLQCAIVENIHKLKQCNFSWVSVVGLYQGLFLEQEIDKKS